MKILLDIDGVMIPARPWQSYNHGPDGFGVFSHGAIKGLNEILKASNGPEIILTTSHKLLFSLEEWRNIFKVRGVDCQVIDRLNTDSNVATRFEEIELWLSQNVDESFIILDDDKSLNELDASIKDEHLILTQAAVGLNQDKSNEAVQKIKYLENLIPSRT